MEVRLKRYSVFVLTLLLFGGQYLFADLEIDNFVTLPGSWSVYQDGDADFDPGPTADYSLVPKKSFSREDGGFFGYSFKFEVGAMSGTGSPMMGDYEPFADYAGYPDTMEADFRSLLEKYNSNLRYQTFAKFEGWHKSARAYNASGYAEVDGEDLGFVALLIEYDWGAHFAVFVFCEAEAFNDNLMAMRAMLGL